MAGNTELEKLILSEEWFYRFTLPSGAQTRVNIPPEIEKIHDTRLAMMFSALDPVADGRWAELTCLDLGCHEGFFAYNLAKRGARKVTGLDGRSEHVRKAGFIRSIYGLGNLEFRQEDAVRMDTQAVEPADAVIMFGLLYHLEDPLGALRKAAALTKKVLLVETQATRVNLTGAIDWGNYKAGTDIQGIFAIVDNNPGNRQGGFTKLSLVPSREGLVYILKALGFARVEVLTPPPDAYEQILTGKRIVVAAYR